MTGVLLFKEMILNARRGKPRVGARHDPYSGKARLRLLRLNATWYKGGNGGEDMVPVLQALGLRE